MWPCSLCLDCQRRLHDEVEYQERYVDTSSNLRQILTTGAPGVDGVITDDPKRFREVCDEWVAGRREVSIGVGKHLYAFWVYCMSLIWVLAFRWRIRATSERRRTAPSIP